MVLIQKDCARINNLRTGRCDFLIVLLTEEAREALLLRNCRPVALLLLLQAAAEGRRERCAVLQRLRGDASHIDAGAAVAKGILFHQRGLFALLCEIARERLARLAEADNQVFIFSHHGTSLQMPNTK